MSTHTHTHAPRRDHVIVEIRAAEGGADARLLVRDQFAIYLRLGALRGL